MSDRPRVVIVNRVSIILPPGDPLSAPLPGSEVVAINLAHGLAASGVPVTYIGNHRGSTLTGVQFRQVTELASVPDGTDLRVVWLRDYAAPDVTFARFPQARHFLLSEDSADDLRALSRWPVARIRARLHDIAAAANGVVFASEWHRTDWESRLGVRVPRGRVIYNLASHVPWRLDPPDAPRHRIIHTSHPRKALAAVAEIATRLVPDGFEVTCLSNPSLYQEESRRIVRPSPQGPINLGTFADFAAAHRRVLRFQAPVPPRRIIDLRDRHGIFLHPDYSGEVGATTVIEAIRRGTIPVVSDFGALPELVADAGIVISGPAWSDEFADRCADAIRQLRHVDVTTFEKGRRALIARFSDDALLAQWRDLLGI